MNPGKRKPPTPFSGSAELYKDIVNFRRRAGGVRVEPSKAPTEWVALTNEDSPDELYFAMKQLEDSGKHYAVVPCAANKCYILTRGA